jgi:AcrR family transcriptional regulator
MNAGSSSQAHRTAMLTDAQLAPTARQILDVAEREFSLHGVEKVSLRELGSASGQRNVSAVSYHFGSREGLLGALLSRRFAQINQLRLQRLRLLTRLDKAGDPHTVIGEAFRVLADAVRHEAWGADFVRVLAQVFFDPELDFHALVPDELTEGYRMSIALVQPALQHLPPATLEDRMSRAYHHGTYALAAWLHTHVSVTPSNEAGYDTYVDDTVDFIVGGVVAPISRAAAR